MPCDSPHQLEAYATFTLPDGAFPGQDDVDRLSEGGCVKRFEDYIDMSYDESEIEISFLRLFAEAWDFDRGVTCMLDAGSPTTGTLEGAQR